ncbi:MAG: ribosome biogenesis GTP-binding protein YihA/YsxC [Acidaminococcus sp.]|jgi:GTP-binding protein|nr:ribosome biogenesis GTP-binding protein YihA/YsxC [Acidaminococcus sp.]MCI2100016.1 ribosome biogenesis GTP-binding protein YihA/YsxC [Acidaminococcus sp.]MCI2114304.1 ribosome biogenesis GTP-binding protein YihA/YsxC [Acidaminococcus sp.]MCI2116913.1 ribosome biogenesis GTP-binding protein YihA/YsxC [Acidaminococcus sp.]
MATAQWDIVSGEFITSAVKATQYPQDTIDEIAFIGRSNVGKSSLLNSLARRKGLARVSSSPGKTQTINFYSFKAKRNEGDKPLWHTFYAVDLPGYGFARTSQDKKNEWSAFICKYMEDRRDLKLVCILMDIRHAPMESDIDCYQWLLSLGLPLLVILTKSDKLNKSAVITQTALYKKTFGLSDDKLITYTSTAHTNRKELIQRIMGFLEK